MSWCEEVELDHAPNSGGNAVGREGEAVFTDGHGLDAAGGGSSSAGGCGGAGGILWCAILAKREGKEGEEE